MARRPIEQELVARLKESNMNFIPRGISHIHDIYALVQVSFPDLCDDEYLCSQHCQNGGNQPEWKHAIRGVLEQLKSLNGVIRKVATRNYWEFL